MCRNHILAAGALAIHSSLTKFNCIIKMDGTEDDITYDLIVALTLKICMGKRLVCHGAVIFHATGIYPSLMEGYLVIY